MFLPPTFSHVWITLLPYQNHIGNFLGIIVTITNSRPSLEKKRIFILSPTGTYLSLLETLSALASTKQTLFNMMVRW